MKRILLGCDLGEAEDDAGREVERQLWPMLDIAHVACAGHAGDLSTMAEAVALANQHQVILSAHPSYPDRENFGRLSMKLTSAELRRTISDQTSALMTLARGSGVAVTHMKPHGALYNDAHRDEMIAEAVATTAAALDLAVVAAPGSQLLQKAQEMGLQIVREAFGDRRYEADGSLVRRSRSDALLLDVDEAALQAAAIVNGGEVVASDGTVVPIRCDTITIHSDMPRSVERLRAIRSKLGQNSGPE